MKTIAFLLTIMVALVLCTPALAQTSDQPTPETLILTDEQGSYPLGLYLEILEDPGGELAIEDVSSPEFELRFAPSQVSVPNYGFTDSVYWVRFRLDNETAHTEHWLLEQGFANTHYIDLYTPLPDGGGFTVRQTGILRPVATRDVPHPRIIFNLTIPTQSQAAYYLRFQNGGSMTLPLTLWTRAAFLSHALVEQTFMGIFFGVLIGLLFYNLFLFFSLRDLNYLYFVILLASLIFEESSYDGYLRIFIIPNLDIPVQYIEPLALPFLIGSMVLFADSFLELKTRLPKLHAASLVILSVWGGLMLLVPFASYRLLADLMAPWSLISLSAVLIAGLASWRGGYRPTRFFLLAWLGLLISMIWIFLVRLGLASSSLLSENAFRIGYLWMAVCWSIALADRINLLKAEAEAANLALRDSENRLSEILEGLPIGVVVYGKDQKPNYTNQRAVDILNNPDQDIIPDISAGRSLAQALNYFSLKVAGSRQAYPAENFPVFSALRGEPAMVDDVEADLVDRLVPLEIWASPVRDDAGNVQSAVVAFQDITQRKQAENELDENRKHLESLVEIRTAELSEVNKQLQLRLDWLSAVNLVNQIMARSADFTEIFQKIIEIINDLFGTHGSFIAEIGNGKQQLKILAHSCRSESNPDLAGTVTTIPERFFPASKPDQHFPAYLSNDQISSIDGPIGKHLQDINVEYIAFIPLIMREQVFGILGLEILGEERHITYEESDLLKIFSTDIAQLIEDSHLFDQSKALILSKERSRLARDLHDSVTQTLFTASVLAEATPRLWDKDQELARSNMDKLSLLIRGALAEMRSLLLELRSGELQNQDLRQLLTTLVEAGRVRTRADISKSFTGEHMLPDNVTLTFYYIAQEALNNAIHHGQATQIHMSLLEGPDFVELRIRDDGRGFIPHDIPEGHLGINIMLERANQIGAELRVISNPGEGAEVILTWSDTVELAENDRANTD